MHLKACRRRFSQREAHKPEAERCPLLEEDDARSQKGHKILSVTPSLDIILISIPPPRQMWSLPCVSNQIDKPVIMKMDTQRLVSFRIFRPQQSLHFHVQLWKWTRNPRFMCTCCNKNQSSTVMAKGELPMIGGLQSLMLPTDYY